MDVYIPAGSSRFPHILPEADIRCHRNRWGCAGLPAWKEMRKRIVFYQPLSISMYQFECEVNRLRYRSLFSFHTLFFSRNSYLVQIFFHFDLGRFELFPQRGVIYLRHLQKLRSTRFQILDLSVQKTPSYQYRKRFDLFSFLVRNNPMRIIDQSINQLLKGRWVS